MPRPEIQAAGESQPVRDGIPRRRPLARVRRIHVRRRVRGLSGKEAAGRNIRAMDDAGSIFHAHERMRQQTGGLYLATIGNSQEFARARAIKLPTTEAAPPVNPNGRVSRTSLPSETAIEGPPLDPRCSVSTQTRACI